MQMKFNNQKITNFKNKMKKCNNNKSKICNLINTIFLMR